MHPLAVLAKMSIETYVRHGKQTAPPEELTPEMAQKAGVFVSIKKRGQLRGCIGTFLPVSDTVAGEVIRNAVCAATQDPRFPPVAAGELDQLEYSVDVLTPPEKIEKTEDLDPRKFGIIVTSGGRKGLLLPALEGVDSVEEQLRIAKMKAGILPHEKSDIFRFTVQRYR